MPRPFRELSIQAFADELARFRFTRTIREVHMHHTESPRKRDFTGVQTIEGMFRHHTQVRGFSDIAQHVSIAPNGSIWTGRDWNRDPASATGHNSGVFMFETIGNFDRGQERLEGAQRSAVVEVIARVQLRLGLPAESLRFHREFSTKTCPGTGITRTEILDAVRRRRAELGGVRDLVFAAERGGDDLAGSRSRSAVAGPRGGHALPFDDRELEPPYPPPSGDLDDVREDGAAGRGAGDPGDFDPGLDLAGRSGLTPAQLDALRPHVVNLRQGRFSGDGAMRTTPADVDAIFREHLPRALREARARGEPLRVLFYAHGGLTSEARGLQYAHQVLPWWRANHVYPVFFIWETGIWETLAQLLGGRRDVALARGLGDVSDRALEEVARAAGGPRIWSAMKYSAERSVGPDGGALYVAHRLGELLRTAGGGVELHAAGHSAGAVFHSFFIPAALAAGAPSFRTAAFLAPAIRVDAFLERLERALGPGRGVDALTVFTMRRSLEEGDNCGLVYRKSLLYLISGALEGRRGEPLLGLESSIRGNTRLRRILGLAGQPGDHEVLWSTTAATGGRRASRATTHGGFDNDRATMESILRRVRGLSDTDPVVPFPADATRDFTFEAGVRGVDDALPPDDAGGGAGAADAVPYGDGRDRAGGRMRALCVGIDAYPAGARLGGCVNDARRWASELGAVGFTVETLLDAQATEAGITAALRRLIDESRPGDVLAFQFAGHGTFFPDPGGDEPDGRDEAVVPVDFDQGRFILDDEQFALFERVPAGVALTCFYDCCHSGSMARVTLQSLVREAAERGGAGEVGVRFVEPTPAMLAEYGARRDRRRARGAARRSLRSPERLDAAIFSACRDDEVALERGGQGVFTGHAAGMLRDAWQGRVANEEFHRRVQRAFGTGSQNPAIDGSRAARARTFLRPDAGAPLPARPADPVAGAADGGPRLPWPAVEQVVKGMDAGERGELRRLLDRAG